ncbi:MAG: SDR family oxidoreductase [Acidimicrobiia bacterium]|nr:SDR family oxidoreductase [Acidimicrobiia bacterium]
MARGTKKSLEGKNVVITGGGGGLGAALGKEFAYAGGNVALLDIDYEAAVLAADAIPRGTATAIECDVTDFAACSEAVAVAEERLGPIDVLVNNAGIAHRSLFAETDLDVIHTIMDTNFWGSVNCTKVALPTLIERRGAIVVISSTAGFAPLLGRTGYAASKHALHGFFTSLRSEVPQVDVMIAAPSFIDTNLRHHTLGGDGEITDHPQSGVGKMASPDDVAERIVWGVEQRRTTLVLGNVGRITRYLNALAPGSYERLMARKLRSKLEP